MANTDEAEEIEITFGDDNNDSASTNPSHPDEEEPDIDNDRGTDVDPNYTATILPGNTERRATRATRDPKIPHCSLFLVTYVQDLHLARTFKTKTKTKTKS